MPQIKISFLSETVDRVKNRWYNNPRLKIRRSGFCRAKARLAAHRKSENILPLNLLSDDKIRRTAVSVYTDLIYGIINL